MANNSRGVNSLQAASLLKVMAQREVDMLLHLGAGRSHEEVYFSDLGHECVAINSESTPPERLWVKLRWRRKEEEVEIDA